MAITRKDQLREKCREHGLSDEGTEAELDHRLNQVFEFRKGEDGKYASFKTSRGKMPDRLAVVLGGKQVSEDDAGPDEGDDGEGEADAGIDVAEPQPEENGTANSTQRTFERIPNTEGFAPRPKNFIKTLSRKKGVVDATFKKMKQDANYRNLKRAMWWYQRAKAERLQRVKEGTPEDKSKEVEPSGDSVMKFGQFAGMTFDKLWKSERDYCRNVHHTPVHKIRDYATMELKAYLVRHSAALWPEADSVIDFGTVHLDRTYADVFKGDPEFCQWISEKYRSDVEELHPGMVRFAKWLEEQGGVQQPVTGGNSKRKMPVDSIGFGKHAEKTFAQLLVEQPKYCACLFRKLKAAEGTSVRAHFFVQAVENYISDGHKDDVVQLGRYKGHTYEAVLNDTKYCKFIMREPVLSWSNVGMIRLAKFLERHGFNAQTTSTQLLAIKVEADAGSETVSDAEDATVEPALS